MIASISDSTLQQYDASLKRWWSYTAKKSINPYLSPTDEVLSFLQEEFLDGSSYSKLNTHRSAISLITCGDSNSRILNRFFKGIYNQRPTARKYNSVWDPQPVVNYLERLHPLESLSLEQLTFKLVGLLALATAHRMQTYSYMRLNNVVRGTLGIEIRITDKIKTSGKGRLQPCLFLPYFKDRTSLCVASTLDYYLKLTADLRSTDSDIILICIKKPHGPASSQTISRWLKEVLKRSGIDTAVFSSYSTRHASTSSAFQGGVNLDTIRKTAGWTESSNVFANFYNCKINKQSDFAKAVLNIT
jgi:hypothetical protein